MRFRRPAGGVVKIADAALLTLDAYRQRNSRCSEAGGVLLGRFILDTSDIIIDQVTTPSRADRRGRFFFWRARDPAQRSVNAAWRGSAQTQHYLGEWHTHPESDPSPSSVDVREWKRILRDAKYEQPNLFFVIVGVAVTRVWEGSKGARTLALLEQLDPAAEEDSAERAS